MGEDGFSEYLITSADGEHEVVLRQRYGDKSLWIGFGKPSREVDAIVELDADGAAKLRSLLAERLS